MIKKYFSYVKPKSGYSQTVYYILNILLPIIVIILVLIGFAWAAALIVLLAKWRMFAMKPRYWLPNLRANSVDIFVGLSIVIFLAGTATFVVQVFWTLFFLMWTVWLKPRSDQVSVMVQALLAQAMALVAFYQVSPDHPIIIGVVVIWLICYISARHFLGAFDETHYRQISAIWGWFGASMAWVLEHWLIEYLTLAQISIIITLVGYGLAFMFYMYKNHQLRTSVKQQIIFTITILLLIVIVFSDWQDKTI